MRLRIEETFNRSTCKKNKFWEKIAQQMCDIGKYNINRTEYYSKYRNKHIEIIKKQA